jgi:hypothetical protein
VKHAAKSATWISEMFGAVSWEPKLARAGKCAPVLFASGPGPVKGATTQDHPIESRRRDKTLRVDRRRGDLGSRQERRGLVDDV